MKPKIKLNFISLPIHCFYRILLIIEVLILIELLLKLKFFTKKFKFIEKNQFSGDFVEINGKVIKMIANNCQYLERKYIIHFLIN